jgi:hypothetical protein
MYACWNGAIVNAQQSNAPEPGDDDPPRVDRMTVEEARQMFEENARYWLNMSGDEFRRKWHNREFGDIDYHPNHLGILQVAFLLPFVEEHEEDTTMVTHHSETSDSVKMLTREEAAESFDRAARHYLGMSGSEFKRKWDAGEFGDVDRHPDHLLLMRVAALLPWAGE